MEAEARGQNIDGQLGREGSFNSSATALKPAPPNPKHTSRTQTCQLGHPMESLNRGVGSGESVLRVEAGGEEIGTGGGSVLTEPEDLLKDSGVCESLEAAKARSMEARDPDFDVESDGDAEDLPFS